MITMNAPSTPRRYSDEQKEEAIDFCLRAPRKIEIDSEEVRFEL